MREKGIETVEQLAQMTPDDLMQIPGIGEKTVEKIRRVVTDYFEQDRGEAAGEEVATAEVEGVQAEEPPAEHAGEVEEPGEAEASAEVSAQPEAAQPEAAEAPPAEETASSEDKTSAGEEGGKEE